MAVSESEPFIGHSIDETLVMVAHIERRGWVASGVQALFKGLVCRALAIKK